MHSETLVVDRIAAMRPRTFDLLSLRNRSHNVARVRRLHIFPVICDLSCDLYLTAPLTVPASDSVTIDGSGSSVVLDGLDQTTQTEVQVLTDSGNVTLDDLTVTDGCVAGPDGTGGAAGVNGALGSPGSDGGSGTPGLPGQGGGLYVADGASADVNNVVFTNDQAAGGIAGPGGAPDGNAGMAGQNGAPERPRVWTSTSGPRLRLPSRRRPCRVQLPIPATRQPSASAAAWGLSSGPKQAGSYPLASNSTARTARSRAPPRRAATSRSSQR